MEIKNWFTGCEVVGANNINSTSLYRNIDINQMIPQGFLESIDVTKITKGNFLSATGYPLCPKKETFALASPDGKTKVRFFFNFDPIHKKNESTASFIANGRPVIVRIKAEEYHKAKQVFEQGLQKMRADILHED